MHSFLSQILFVFSIGIFLACSTSSTDKRIFTNENQEYPFNDSTNHIPFKCEIETPTCTDSACYGTYRGVEFIPSKYIELLGLNGTDVAHQYSNKISKYVGDKLKQLYRDSLYSRVDFRRIKMTTRGMNSDSSIVEYFIYIPFKRVPKHLATTAFDHCGGWGHKPELKKRIYDLTHSPENIVKNKRLWISKLMKTKEGLEEYWIQWQHSAYQ